MRRNVQVTCPDCHHEQYIVVDSERDCDQVTLCAGQERDASDSFVPTGCGKNFVVRASWTVSVQVGALRWPEQG